MPTGHINTKFAIIKTGGKQYPVSEGTILKVEKLGDNMAAGSSLELETLLVADGDKVMVGKPNVQGAKVIAEFVADGKEDKIRITRFQQKSNRHRTYGHRQPFATIKIVSIKA